MNIAHGWLNGPLLLLITSGLWRTCQLTNDNSRRAVYFDRENNVGNVVINLMSSLECRGNGGR